MSPDERRRFFAEAEESIRELRQRVERGRAELEARKRKQEQKDREAEERRARRRRFFLFR